MIMAPVASALARSDAELARPPRRRYMTARFGSRLCVALLLVPGLALHSQQVGSASDRAALMKAREAVWRSWYNDDSAAIRSLVPPDLIAINPGDPHWQNREEFIASAKDFAAHRGKLISLVFSQNRDAGLRRHR